MNELLAGTIDQAKSISVEVRNELMQAEVAVRSKSISNYTAKDWNVMAFSALSDGKKDDAINNWRCVSESSDATDVEVASSMFNMAVALFELGRSDEAIKVYDKIINLYEGSPDTHLERYVAHSLGNKGAVLSRLGKRNEANNIYDFVINKFGSTSDSEFIEPVSNAMGNRGWNRYIEGNDSSFFADSLNAVGMGDVGGGVLCNYAFSLYVIGAHRKDIIAAYRKAWDVIQNDELWETLALIDLRNHGRTVRLDADPVPDDLIAEVAALAVNKD